MLRIWGFLLIGAFSTLMAGGGQAAESVFTVDRVAVDAVGETAAAARELALRQGRAAALTKILRRLAPKDYWPILPSFSNREAVDLVAGIQVSNEKISSTRYLAEITYSFNPNGIRQVLKSNQIPFSETVSRMALVVPVFETLDGTFLWEPDNPWGLAWQNQRLVNELVPLLAALGELEDIVTVNAQDALAGDWTKLGVMASRYGVSDIVVAYARWEKGPFTDDLYVRLTRYGAPRGRAVGEPVEVVIRNTDQAELSALLGFGIEQSFARLQRRWKAQTIIRSDAVEDVFRASVRFSAHEDWLTIRQRLDGLASVTGLDVVAISMTGAEVLLRHVGSIQQLSVAMEQLDLSLINTDMMSIIVLGEYATQVPDLLPRVSPQTEQETLSDIEMIELRGIEDAPMEESPEDAFIDGLIDTGASEVQLSE